MEPRIFKDVEREIWKVIDQFTTPNVVKYIILNREAYKELIDYYAPAHGIKEYPDTFLDCPIILDVDAKERVRVFSNCYTEFCLRKR